MSREPDYYEYEDDGYGDYETQTDKAYSYDEDAGPTHFDKYGDREIEGNGDYGYDDAGVPGGRGGVNRLSSGVGGSAFGDLIVSFSVLSFFLFHFNLTKNETESSHLSFASTAGSSTHVRVPHSRLHIYSFLFIFCQTSSSTSISSASLSSWVIVIVIVAVVINIDNTHTLIVTGYHSTTR